MNTWQQDPNYPQYERNTDTGQIRAVGAKPKYQYPQSGREYVDDMVRLAPKAIMWGFLIIVVLPILLGLILIGALIVL